MIWCRFQDNGSAKYGIVEDDQVTVVNGEPWGEHTVTGPAGGTWQNNWTWRAAGR